MVFARPWMNFPQATQNSRRHGFLSPDFPGAVSVKPPFQPEQSHFVRLCPRSVHGELNEEMILQRDLEATCF